MASEQITLAGLIGNALDAFADERLDDADDLIARARAVAGNHPAADLLDLADEASRSDLLELAEQHLTHAQTLLS